MKDSIGSTVSNDGSRSASVESLFSSASSTSITSEGSTTGELNKTVVEIEPDYKIEIEIEPDYKALYHDCKRLLDEKTENLSKEIATLSVDYKSKTDEVITLRNSYKKLELSKQELENEVEENKKMQNSLKQATGCIQASYMHLNRNAEDIFKVKPKKRGSSTASLTLSVNKCEALSCGAEDIDLVRCSICSKYVCETCNEIPVGKL